MHAKLLAAAFLVALVCVCRESATAQLVVPQPVVQQPVSSEYQPYVPQPYYQYSLPYYGNGGYGWDDWSAGSTVAGSYLLGLGSAIRAAGQYNLMTSQAAINLEQADRMDIENQLQWTNTYFEMRRVNQAYQASQRAPRPGPDTWVRLAQQGETPRPASGAVDPVNGRISWPNLLQGNDFKQDREKLDKLFQDRAVAHGAIGIAAHAQIQQATDDMLITLKAHIREIDTKYYTEARNFITSLAREADFPARSVPQPPAPSPG